MVLFAVISATSYYQFLGSTPFEITCGNYGQQINYVHAKIWVHTESIGHVWQRVQNKEVHGVSIPCIHSSLVAAIAQRLLQY